MLSTYLYIDRDITDSALARAFADSFMVDLDQVTTMAEDDYEALGRAWANDRIRVVLRRATIRGDFPLSILVNAHKNRPIDILDMVKVVAGKIDAAILTDEVEVNPVFDDDWLLVAPDGATAVVSADLDELDSEVPSIVLIPESRETYEFLVAEPRKLPVMHSR